MKPTRSDFTAKEMTIIERYHTPFQVQRFLRTIPYNREAGGATCLSFRGAIKKNRAHCLEGALVAAMFTVVHIPQYSGAWASITGLFLLSFVLTFIRAKTKSILPSFVIHLVFNAVGVYEILRGNL